jgi:hypothetical protein
MPEIAQCVTQGDPCVECNQRGHTEVSRAHSTFTVKCTKEGVNLMLNP